MNSFKTRFLFPSFEEEYSLISFSHNTRCRKEVLTGALLKASLSRSRKRLGRGFAGGSQRVLRAPFYQQIHPLSKVNQERGQSLLNRKGSLLCKWNQAFKSLYPGHDFSQPPFSLLLSLEGSSRTDWVTCPRPQNVPPEEFGMTH